MNPPRLFVFNHTVQLIDNSAHIYLRVNFSYSVPVTTNMFRFNQDYTNMYCIMPNLGEIQGDHASLLKRFYRYCYQGIYHSMLSGGGGQGPPEKYHYFEQR